MKTQKPTLRITILLFFIVCLLFFVYSFLLKPQEYIQGKKIFGHYTEYKGDIYFVKRYKLLQVDRVTFRPLNDEIWNRHIALDKNHVYCGENILPHLDPTKTHAIAHSYYSDGNLTYYCSYYRYPNPDLAWWDEIWDITLNKIFNIDKRPFEIHNIVALPQSEMPYRVLPNITKGIVTNGTRTYYDGLLMKDANWQTLKPIAETAGHSVSNSSVYSTDGKNVYFKNEKLPLQYNDEIYALDTNHLTTELYLINPKDGMVYLENKPFDNKNAPYTPISKYDEHTYQTLFLSDNGIYFYNRYSKSIERAGDNVFAQGVFEEISPLVFSDGKKTLFVDAKMHKVSIRRSLKSGIHYHSTFINELDEGLIGRWQNLGSVSAATIWQNGNNYFYFNQRGEDEGFDEKIYKIHNKQIADEILQNNPNFDELRNLVQSQKLTKVKYKELVEARTIYDATAYYATKYEWLIILAFIVLGYLAKRERRYLRRKTEEYKRDKLKGTE
ncbi:DKNYY domain-containing protein [Neisseria montereyensis]|uniref:DKNYY domain-containing protein n=1 Tax=Neisseria montereyensis TaxID=2973938 RepID=A0ABT2F9Z6_9NEIS|nr:DKNYY domain-containing protein [Neisseria montereyensis]MCS4533019.1 DKNYY domain-containing protein [Neisseria montereyensis]